jgi:hypothetical protein
VDTCRGTNPVSRGSGKGWGRGVARSMESGVAGGSWGEVGPRGEVPVQVVRHREEKAGDPARGGKKARPGGGFRVSPPLLAPWTSPDRRRGGKMEVSALPAPPPSPPGTWGLITSQKGSQSPQHQGAFKETPRGFSRLDFRVPELCPVRRRGWGSSCPLATPRQGMQGQDEALHRFWRESVSARAKAIWKGILQPGVTQTRDGAGPPASLRAVRRGP